MHPLRRRLSMLASVAALASAILASACGRPRRESPPRVDPAPQASVLSSASPASRPTATGWDARDEGPSAPPPSGGPWATCADGFRISGQPLRDATRLGLLCGPPVGLRRPEPVLERVLGPDEAFRFDVPLAAGECLRLVAALAARAPLSVVTSGAPGVTSTVIGSEGWLLTRRGGPLCTSEAVTVHVVVTSPVGGNVAVGRWFLPP